MIILFNIISPLYIKPRSNYYIFYSKEKPQEYLADYTKCKKDMGHHKLILYNPELLKILFKHHCWKGHSNYKAYYGNGYTNRQAKIIELRLRCLQRLVRIGPFMPTQRIINNGPIYLPAW